MTRILIVILFASTACLQAQWDETGRVPLYGYQDATYRESYVPVRSLAVDHVDRIVTTSIERPIKGKICTLTVQRFHADGVADNAFAVNGTLCIATDTIQYKIVRGVYIDSSNAILVIIEDSTKAVLWKMLPNGAIDTSYGVNGNVVVHDPPWNMYTQASVVGHEVYLSCLFHGFDTIRVTVMHITESGTVLSDSVAMPYSVQCPLVTDLAVFTFSGRSIIKWTKSGVIDSTFGKNGVVEWRKRSGGGWAMSSFHIDDTTVACFGTEEDHGPAVNIVEWNIIYFDKRTGEIRRHLRAPFYVWSNPSSHMKIGRVSSDGVVTMAGYHLKQNSWSPHFVRFDRSDKIDSTFFGTGSLIIQPKVPNTSVELLDFALLSNNDVVFIESTRMLGRLFVKTTSVDEQIETPSAPVVVFPNPTSGRFELSSTADLKDCSFAFTTLTGKILASGILSHSNAIELPTFIPSGTYGLHLRLSSGEMVSLNVVLIR